MTKAESWRQRVREYQEEKGYMFLCHECKGVYPVYDFDYQDEQGHCFCYTCAGVDDDPDLMMQAGRTGLEQAKQLNIIVDYPSIRGAA